MGKIREFFCSVIPTFKERSKKKILNAMFKLSFIVTGIACGWAFYKPRVIGIEPTNRCNLNCVMCARRYWDEENNKPGDMSIELFRNKIFPFLSGREKIILQCFGEPLLAEYFFEMLNESKKKGCSVAFDTNGLLLKKYARRLVELETDYIGISIDGIKSFKNIRGVEIDSIVEGIKEINFIKHELKKMFPILNIDFVAMEQNVSELPDLVDFANNLKIERITVVHAVIHSKKLINQSLFLHPETAKKYFYEAQSKAKKLKIKLNLPSLKMTTRFCSQPFELMFIKWNGDVVACCSNTIYEDNALMLGNLSESSLPQLWNNSQMCKIRMAQLGMRRLPEFCRNCAVRVCSLESHTRVLKGG
ncbi:MAG: SPASM domain-containing protein [Candidatus Omnitrophica bacterium]|nr:SPASM domain-containing protein [Candidatus Omnitrophota bacterium]